MTIELRKGQHSVNILNVYIMKNHEDKILLTPMSASNEEDARPLHVYIDSQHILSSFALTIDREDAAQMRMFID